MKGRIRLIDSGLNLPLNLRRSACRRSCLRRIDGHQDDLHGSVSRRCGRSCGRTFLQSITAAWRRHSVMTVRCGIVAPLRREAVWIEFFHYGASVQSRTNREGLVTTLDMAKEQSFVLGQSHFGAAIQLPTATPNRAARAAALMTLAFDHQIRLPGNRNRDPRGPVKTTDSSTSPTCAAKPFYWAKSTSGAGETDWDVFAPRQASRAV